METSQLTEALRQREASEAAARKEAAGKKKAKAEEVHALSADALYIVFAQDKDTKEVKSADTLAYDRSVALPKAILVSNHHSSRIVSSVSELFRVV